MNYDGFGIKVMIWTLAYPLFIVFVVALSLLMPVMASPSFAAMEEVSEEELQQVTAAGFSNFTLSEEGVARAYFNIVTKSYTEIDSLKMGYYVDDSSSLGWDQDWRNVSFGTQDTDLVVRGFYIEASFTNISDPSSRTLNSIRVGTPSMTGTISAGIDSTGAVISEGFNSFSGQITPGGATPVNGHRLYLGPATITCVNSSFSASLSTSGPEKGWWMSFDNATITYH